MPPLAFAHPPIVELALGAQFSPLTNLTSAHLGLFWQSLGEEWSEPSDGPLLQDQFESFGSPRWAASPGLQLRFGAPPYPGRLIVGHRDKNRLLQVQQTRFHLNWRRVEGFYPSYTNLIAEFEQAFQQFVRFVGDAKLGEVLLNQWELTYVDSFPKGAGWQSPADWRNILPGLFSSPLPTDGLGVVLELDHRAAEWSYEIFPKRGRLHIAANYGPRDGSENDSLLLTLTARGPLASSDAASLRAGLDLGHEAALGAFLKATSANEQKRWGPLK